MLRTPEDIFQLFQEAMSLDASAVWFPNQRGQTAVELPTTYAAFVKAPERIVPSNWQLYSYFGNERTTLDSVQSELTDASGDHRWLLFGKTGDEDCLVFDRDSKRGDAVVWCDAEDIAKLEQQRAYADSFLQFLIKVAYATAAHRLERANQVLAKLIPIRNAKY